MWAELAAAKRELKAMFDAALSHVFIYTLTAKSSPRGDLDSIESQDEGNPILPDGDPNKKSQRSVVRIQPFGFNSVPPRKLRALTLRLGASNLLFIGIAPQKVYGPQDLDVGETAIFCSANGTRVYLDKNGVVHVDAATGQDVIVNGGNAKIGRVGDNVDLGKFIFVPGSGGASLSWVPPSGGPPQTITTGTELTGQISAGADHFKG